MPIDIHKEVLLTLQQAAQSLPGRVAPSTLWRWHRKGIRSIRLETVVVGGKRYTSTQALERFAAALTAASEPPEERAMSSDSPPDRDAAIRRKLEAAKLL